jgi:hypothetical protein
VSRRGWAARSIPRRVEPLAAVLLVARLRWFAELPIERDMDFDVERLCMVAFALEPFRDRPVFCFIGNTPCGDSRRRIAKCFESTDHHSTSLSRSELCEARQLS